ncbi:hypothetical protein DFJ74DRAFT_261076 [Hyaloraphidium curvatum]|nr:hypothetical protein DFJ74DRAFT_261076 [Hyaloraphidium curvatum]
MKVSLCLAALAALLAQTSAAPLLRRVPRPPQELSTEGVTAVGCDNASPPSLACPAGRVIQVQHAFWGRDVPMGADPSTCPGNPTTFPPGGCSLAANDAAALTAWVAGLCDGKQSCSGLPGQWDLLAVFDDPCVNVVKRSVVTYACRDATLDAPAIPAAVPTATPCAWPSLQPSSHPNAPSSAPQPPRPSTAPTACASSSAPRARPLAASRCSSPTWPARTSTPPCAPSRAAPTPSTPSPP